MSALLQIVGFGWALIGLGNIILAEDVSMTFVIIFNMVVHILPGLMVGGIGLNKAKN